MTKAQMQACVAAATNAGFAASATPDSSDPLVWSVRVTAPGFDIDASSAASLATAQSVTARVSDVRLF
jgi:hypothetical protein